MRPAWKKWVLGGAAVAVVAIVAAAVVLLRSESSPSGTAASTSSSKTPVDDPSDVAAKYLKAFASGDSSTASGLTDDVAGSSAMLVDARKGLNPTKVEATLNQVNGTTGSFRVSWTVGPGRVWTYDNTIELVKTGERWLVRWTPALVHPKLQTGQHLLLRTATGTNAVVDRDGKPLLTWQASGTQAVDAKVAPLLLPALGRVAGDRGKDSWSIALVDDAGKQLETLQGQDETAVEPLTSTLGIGTQAAAQAAVDGAGAPAMLVAIQPSTGDILAVAQNSAAGNDPKALSGLYAPGSTFKIATAAAALEQGSTTADTVLECPSSVQLGQRTIPNDEGFSLPPIPLHSAFAQSCNTTFAQLASGMPDAALANAASQFGINADFEIPGIACEAGKVVATTSQAERVEAGIGQGKVQASPFGVALMAATVASGKAVTPKLWHGLDTNVNTGYQAPSGTVIGALRTMMREVVTGGTATALQGSGRVYGKTGTAQFGDGSQANGWFAGYRGDLAFAVLLLESNSSKAAVSVSAKFLGGVPG